MEIKRLDEMKNGWFAGNFSPAALNINFGEAAIKKYRRYHIESAYCHPNATVMYMLISGYIQLNGKILNQPCTMAVFHPGEQIYFTALADSTVLLFVYGDCDYTRGKGIILNDLLNAYSCFNEFGEERKLTIDPRELTFVVQGPVKEITPVCLESIRLFFPESTIIFSTERGQPVQKLDYDVLAESDDPGTIEYKSGHNPPINQNRQLVSTVAGLKRVTTKYAMKIRSDMVLTGRRLASYLHEYPLRANELQLFKERVIIGELWTRKRLTYYENGQCFTVPHLFHPSDFFMLGLTEDLHSYFLDTRLVTNEEILTFSPKNDILHKFAKRRCGWRYTTEQFFALEALERKFPGIKDNYQDWSDWSKEAENLSDLFMGNNFIVLDLKHHGIAIPKHEMFFVENYMSGPDSKYGYFNKNFFNNYFRTVICKR